ncbi:histidinol-phosphate aminotransferase [Legionella beliardensis]|uniref:Histidinol-phosphate aminotransferase n=1 Tax=Legionella beliardensis TaxID=91822 RepID=A0A378I0I5_9GAMM|nr:histidinol-phosphate transaminase [Legionella beliardensis]STX28261.1 histidinol-phosphate aminotransferase [Legionella beliardensis]
MPCDYQQLPHIGIRNLNPYVPGKSVEELSHEQGITDIIKLASNENPLGCSFKVNAAINKLNHLKIATYPDAANHPIKKKLSAKLGVSESNLALSNGSDLLFSLLLTIFGLHTNKHMLTHDQAFITYSIQAQILSIPVRSSPLLPNWEVDIEAMVKMANENTAIIFLANPNNPTGLLIPLEKIHYLLKNVPDSTLVVIDEAYYEYAYEPHERTSLSLLEQFSNLVVTRTFSKAYGLAGLRLGYAIAHPDIINLLHKVQLPFSVNQAALAGGYAALEDEQFLADTIDLNAAGLKQMQQGLNALNLSSLPSACNFITFDCGKDGLTLYQQLLEKGIIVRPLNAYALPNHLRVSIGMPEHNTRFLNNLAACLAT